MVNTKKITKKPLRIGFGKDIKTEHFPITIASGLDVLMELDGYKRVPQGKNDSDEFVWENDKGERLTATYYNQVNKITYSEIFNENFANNEEDVVKRLSSLYGKLNSTIGSISQYVGSPYVASTKELLLEIQGANPSKKAQFLIPIIRELYREVEDLEPFSIDTLERTNSSVEVYFGPLES